MLKIDYKYLLWLTKKHFICLEKSRDLQIDTSMNSLKPTKQHCINYQNFTKFPGVEILWKRTVSTEFWANRPKLCGNSTFPKNFHAMKLSEVAIFYTVQC